MKKTIPYGHQSIDNEDIKEAVRALKSEWLTQGPKVKEFEEAMADYCGTKYALAVSSGTAALHLAYLAAGIKNGDEIITTPLTFAATSNMAALCGAKPVFADIKSDTLNINPQEIEKRITSKTKVIAPVDFAGRPCDYDEILKIAKKRNLLVVEDACHSLGSKYKGKKVGSFADMTVLSFHPVKTITSGEGGMILTNNENFYEKLKILRHHGIIKRPENGPWYYEIENLGFNYRLTDFQSALGLSQLKKLDKFVRARKIIVKKYNEAFKDTREIIIPEEKNDTESARHIYAIQLRLELLKIGRREIFEELQKKGIGVQVHYVPLHLHPFYQREFGYKKGDFPVAENYYNRAITLPLFPKMTDKDIDRIIKTTKEILINAKK